MVFLLSKEDALLVFQGQLNNWDVDLINTEQAFQFALVNSYIDEPKLASFLNIKAMESKSILKGIYLFQVNDQIFLHCIYNNYEVEGELAFIQRSKAIFLKYSLHFITEMQRWFNYYIEILERTVDSSLVDEELQLLMQHIQSKHRQSLQLKACKISELLYLFTKGEHNYSYVLREMVHLKTNWQRGKWALSKKELALFSYLAMDIAFSKQQWKKINDEASYLLKQDKFMDVAVELIIEYGHLLKTASPQPDTLLKNYRATVLENFFYMYISALVELRKYDVAFELIKQNEMASCSTIYQYLQQPDEEKLIAIEASVQKNIALLIDESVSYVGQSLQKWSKQFRERSEAKISSQYISCLLEVLFACEQYELFERLMEIYSRYVKFDEHYERLKDRIARLIEMKEYVVSN